ncbi:MAG: hypothetical protein Q7U38_11380, partial [Methylobacter sp.]|nr:hypothetical protein [Methylobacter sp.]
MSDDNAPTPAAPATTAVSTVADEASEALDIKRFLSSMRLNPDISEPVPMISNNLETVAEDIRDEDRFISGMAAVL